MCRYFHISKAHCHGQVSATLGVFVNSHIAVVLACVFFQGAAVAEGIFIHSYNEESDRFAILDETDQVAFLYLTHQGTQKPEKDAIAYMRVNPPEKVDWKAMAKAGIPPILSAEIASSGAAIYEAEERHFTFSWSRDGTSAALIYRGEPIAFVTISERIGYSKAVAVDNKLTNSWNQALYEQLFAD